MFIVGAVIGGVAAIGGGLIAANGAKQAANAQVGAANRATDAQLEMFNKSNELSAPGRNLGFGAQGLLAKLYGIDPGTLTNTSYSNTPNGLGQAGPSNSNPRAYTGERTQGNMGIGRRVGGMSESGPGGVIEAVGMGRGQGMQVGPDGKPIPGTGTVTTNPTTGKPDYSGFYDSPGFQFAKDLGNQQIQRSQAAGGGLYSANTQTLESQYTTGFASQHYNDYVQQLLNMAGMGNGSAEASGRNAVATGQGISNNAISAGNAAASGINGQAGAIQGALGGIGNAVQGYYQNRSPNTFHLGDVPVPQAPPVEPLQI